ncbi:hypothetical protein ACMDXM_000296 [Enterococcus faecalis]|nr:hypothetical protein [Enterococcus faecalis]
MFVNEFFILTACNGSKLDKTGEEFKDSIIKDSAYGDEYSEDSFSFLMYKDKDTNRYLADFWVPVKDEASALEYFYYYDEDKRLDSTKSKVTFNDMKARGKYEYSFYLKAKIVR